MTETSSRMSLTGASDQLLAGRATDGDERAFETIVRRYGPMMRAYAARLLGSNSETDDVVQEAFITAWNRLSTLDNPEALKSWLMRIVNHKAIDVLRSRHIATTLNIEHEQIASPVGDHPSHITEARSRNDAFAVALDLLPELQRQCWVLKELGEYSYDEIAEELDLPTSTVRGLLSRARKKLTTEMEGWR